MPNIKISQLPYLSSPDPSGLIPIVQAGVTYRTDMQQVIDVLLGPELAGVFQILSAKSQLIDNSTTSYPSNKAVKDYTDGLLVGLLSDRGNYTPGLVSPGAFPTTGGRGPGGIPAKGDLWFVAANGFLGTTAVTTGQSVRALVDAPGQTATNWDILDVAGWTVAPEDSANKVISKAQFIADGASIVKYPSIKAVKDYIDTEVTLQDVINNSTALVDEVNTQGTGAGSGMAPGVISVNAFGNFAASSNTGDNVNAFGSACAQDNTGDHVNAMGLNAANLNTGNNVVGIGNGAADSNNSDEVVAIGKAAVGGAGAGGTDLCGIGSFALYQTTGIEKIGIGINAGRTSSGDQFVGIGTEAGRNNSGQDVVFLGTSAGKGNLAAYVHAMGVNSADTNSGDYVNAMGSNSAQNNTGNHVNAFGKGAGLGNSYNNVSLLGEDATADNDSQLVFSSASGFNQRLDCDGINGDRKVTMPDASGTMVLSVNGNAPDPAGNVTIPISGGLPYLIYAAYVQFGVGGSIASVTQLYNTIGDGSGNGITDISITATTLGFDAVMTAGPFTTKSVVVPGGYFALGNYYGITGERQLSGIMNLYSIRTSNGGFQKPAGINVYVEIRIYP